MPKDPYCDACQRAKTENIKSHRQDSPCDKEFEKFGGDHDTIDTMVLHGLGNRGNHGETDAVVFYDLATGWLESVPVKSRTNTETLRVFEQVFGELRDVNTFSMDVERRYAPSQMREVYCDKAREFISVRKKVGIPVMRSTPGMPRTNAVAESKVKLVLHGARVALRQAGLEAKFWPYAGCRHFCLARNIEINAGESAFQRRYGEFKCDGQHLPYGCLIGLFPLPSRKKLDEVPAMKRFSGEEYATPADIEDDAESVDFPDGVPDLDEWIEDGDEKMRRC